MFVKAEKGTEITKTKVNTSATGFNFATAGAT